MSEKLPSQLYITEKWSSCTHLVSIVFYYSLCPMQRWHYMFVLVYLRMGHFRIDSSRQNFNHSFWSISNFFFSWTYNIGHNWLLPLIRNKLLSTNHRTGNTVLFHFGRLTTDIMFYDTACPSAISCRFHHIRHRTWISLWRGFWPQISWVWSNSARSRRTTRGSGRSVPFGRWSSRRCAVPERWCIPWIVRARKLLCPGRFPSGVWRPSDDFFLTCIKRGDQPSGDICHEITSIRTGRNWAAVFGASTIETIVWQAPCIWMNEIRYNRLESKPGPGCSGTNCPKEWVSKWRPDTLLTDGPAGLKINFFLV